MEGGHALAKSVSSSSRCRHRPPPVKPSHILIIEAPLAREHEQRALGPAVCACVRKRGTRRGGLLHCSQQEA
jgi:hypothetical protein